MANIYNSINNKIRYLLVFSIVLFLTLFGSSVVFAFTPDSQDNTQVQNTSQQNSTQKSKLIVGSEQDYPPFATGMTDATAGGFTVDLWKAVATEADLKYTIRVLPFHELLQEFNAGKIDVLINLAQSEQRKQFADFTVPHIVVHGAIFVRKDENSIRSENDFAGKSIIVLSADLAHDYAVAKGWGKQLVLVNTAEEGLHLLASGKHDAMLLSKLVGMQTLQASGLTSIKALKTNALFSQKFSFAVQKGQSDLLSNINEGLALTKSNESYNKLYEKWFGVYEVKEVHFQDVLKYLIPLVFIFAIVLVYLLYQRRVEQIQAHNALKQREAHLKAILETSSDCVKVVARDGTLLSMNPAGLALIEAETPDTVINQCIYPIAAPEYRDAFKLFNEQVCDGMSGSMEFEIIGLRGTRRWMETRATPFQSEQYGIQLQLAFTREITDRKQLETLNQESLVALRRAESVAKLGNWSLNIKTGKLDWSDEVFNIFEIDKDQLKPTYEAFLAAIHPEDRGLVNSAYANSLVKKEKYSVTHRLLMKDGRVKYVTEQCESDFDEAGNPLHSIGTIQDITERWHVDNATRIAATVFESHEGMMVTDPNSIILRVNHAFTKITGYSAEEVVGKKAQLLSSGCDDSSFYADIWKSVNDTGVWEGEVRSRRKDGEAYLEHIKITAVTDATGMTINYVVTLTDITVSKAAADAIKNLAFYDSLTHLPNRRLLVDRLSQTMNASKRSNTYGALMFLDLDNFKPLNDTHGHVVGDMLLIEAAQRLTNCMRDMDTVARFGGDEFVVMLAELGEDKSASIAQATIVAEKVSAVLSEPYVFTISHEAQADTTVEHSCSASIGVVMFINHESNQDDIINLADAAMYEAKNAGRNQIRFYGEKS